MGHDSGMAPRGPVRLTRPLVLPMPADLPFLSAGAGPADGEQDGALSVPCGGDGGAGPRVPTPCTTALPYHGRRLHGTILF